MENRDAEVAREDDILEIYHENSKNVRWMMRNRKAHQVHYEKPVLELMARGPKAYENPEAPASLGSINFSSKYIVTTL